MEYLSLLNLLLVPMVVLQLKIEHRLTRLEAAVFGRRRGEKIFNFKE
jgi:hypothetical protein